MLNRSFIFLPGIGPRTEKKLWDSGILDWDSFLGAESAGPIKGIRKRGMDPILQDAVNHLKKRDITYFSRFFRAGEAWRLWSTFRERTVFLDIETMGLSRYAPITVVGVYDGREYRAAVRGFNLSGEEISRMLEGAEMIVTFNGATFDLPMIQQHYPGSVPSIPHLDLRFLGRKVGYSGGLKKLERALGIKRPDEVSGMSGDDAVRLWKIWEREGNENALKLILKYNKEDIVNLEPIAEILVSRMVKNCGHPQGGNGQ